MRQDGWPHQGLEGPHAKSTSFLHRDLSHGKMRHDLIVPRDRCGALIGPGGSVFKDMSARIGAGVHIFDRDLVPGEPEERRLVVVTGSPQQCMLAAAEVMLITSRPNDPNKVFTSGPLAGHRVQDQRPGQAGRLGLDFSPSAVLTIAAQPPPPPVPPPPPPEPAPDGAAAAPYGLPGLAPPGAPTFETSKHESTGGFVFKRRLDQWPLPSDPNPAAALSGKHLFRLLEAPGTIRHDCFMRKKMCNRAIGPKGATFKGMEESTGCRIYIIDARPPPEGPDDVRQVSLVGLPSSVRAGYEAMYEVLDDGRGLAISLSCVRRGGLRRGAAR